ncbi:esterase-like activity of phytase family protein [Quadrisphaera oryzae]|uniref:esterase-like activity of phytase family protein n=1 Tax=Quadrisphaera TaxID=317661 RepID=UPI0016471366|nr:esterase-like activity of phytase family protein [Quadrisphaera sp. RL12-1S]MBC3760124.1 esterase-like activity of phytase family protein [Quadrisphaera sp. RL12-1S]
MTLDPWRSRAAATVSTLLAGLVLAGTVAGPVAVAAAGPEAAASDRAGASAAGRCSAAVSLTGYSDALDGTTFQGVPVSGLSALGVTGRGDVLALSDRSALFTLGQRSHRPERVVRLAAPDGSTLDSEGLAVDGDGTVWVSSETGPRVLHLAADGSVLGELEVPAALRVAPVGRAQENASFEGLTLSADRKVLLAADEASLSGDADGVVRFQTWTRPDASSSFSPGPQLAYRADPGLGVSEVLLAPDGRLVVLERGYLPAYGNTVRLYLVDPHLADGRAHDVSGTAELSQDDDAVLGKQLLADLVTCPSGGARAQQQQANPLLDNVEGMALVGADGDRLRLLLVSDDNGRPSQTTRLLDLVVRLPAAHR